MPHSCSLCEERPAAFLTSVIDTGDTMYLCPWCMLPFAVEMTKQIPDGDGHLAEVLSQSGFVLKAPPKRKAKVSDMPPSEADAPDGEPDGDDDARRWAEETASVDV